MPCSSATPATDAVAHCSTRLALKAELNCCRWGPAVKQWSILVRAICIVRTMPDAYYAVTMTWLGAHGIRLTKSRYEILPAHG